MTDPTEVPDPTTLPTTADGRASAAVSGAAADPDGDAVAILLRAGASPIADADVGALVARALARADADGLVDVAWTVADSPIGPSPWPPPPRAS